MVFPSHRRREINAKAFLETVWKGRLYIGKQVDGIVTGLVKEGKVERYRCQYNTRHTFILMMLEAHVSPAQVAKWVGNSPFRHYATLRRYYANTSS